MSQLDAATLAALQVTFLEESFEGLDRAEAGLLQLADRPDPEVIGELFRAIHSIKGGAGAFSLTEITELAHVMENLLDDLRSGTPASAEACAALLAGVDELRATLRTPADQRAQRALRHGALVERLVAARNATRPAAPAAAPAPAPVAAPPVLAPWRVEFAPHASMMQTGNDPLRIVRELVELGAQVTADLSRVPALADLDPTQVHLRWTLRVPGNVARGQLEEAFAWVDGECTLAIAREEAAAPAAGAEPAPTLAVVPDPAITVPEPTAVAPAPPAPPPSAARDDHSGGVQNLTSVRVGIDKIDLLMNMVGELVITQSMLGELDSDGPITSERSAQIREGLLLLARNTRALQESVVRLRSMPVSVVFARLPRMIHDLGRKLGKRVELETTGQTTELDKTVLEKLGDPLVHIVRNSIDHGLEPPEERIAAGKTPHGTIHLNAEHRGSAIILEVTDDGRGLDLPRILAVAKQRGLVPPDAQLRDEEIANLVFQPGFSTAQTVSDVSGRGVGMDVVWRHLKEVGGDVHIESMPGKGTRTTLRVPLTLAIIDGQLIKCADQSYVMPLLSIVETVHLDPSRLKRVGASDVYRVRDEIVPVIDLGVAFGLRMDRDPSSRLLMIVEADGARLGLIVDELLAQQQIVVKSLETNFGRIEGLAGATILGDGQVAFIIDIVALTRGMRRNGRQLAA